MHNRQNKWRWFFMVWGCFFSTLAEAWQGHWNMPLGVTPVSHEIYHLHMLIFYVCVAISVAVFGVLIYSLIRFRKSKGAVAASFHENTVLEVVWAVVPLLILVGMAIPATRVLIRMNDTSAPQLTVLITGYQWKWRYDYLDHGLSYYSNLSTPRDQIEGKSPKGPFYLAEVDKPVVVPTRRKIRFLVTSNDVIHSWWVPELGIKRDAVPGFIYDAWARIETPGIYRGACAELCGVNHAYMPIVVDAREPEAFDAWMAEQIGGEKAAATAAPVLELPEATLLAKGKQVHEQYCSVCHKVDGVGMPPAFPSLVGSKVVIGPLEDQIKLVLHGRSGTAMQAFKEQLNDSEIAAVITYHRQAFGNDQLSKVHVVQPKQIREMRN